MFVLTSSVFWARTAAAKSNQRGLDVMQFIQKSLLMVYRGIRQTGFLSTSMGRWVFEGAYWAYKSLLEARDVGSLRTYVTSGSTVIDVGANIGFFTVPFAKWVGAEGRVISVEPEPANCSSLRRRVERLGLGQVVSIVEAAAVETAGEVKLALNPDHPADHRVAVEGIRVRATTVDAIMVEKCWPSISLIKIDVQGSEVRVIRGATKTLSRFRPTLFVELDESNLREAGTSSAALLDDLSTRGYRPHLRDEKGTWTAISVGELHDRMNLRGYLDVLFLVSNDNITGSINV
jgi:FkbM family methyltransferase